MRRLSSGIAAAAAVVMAVFAAAPVPAQDKAQTPPALDFSAGPTFRADVASLDVAIADVPPTEYPQVGHLAPTPFAQAVRDWSAARFSLTGNSVHTLRVTLKEGRIVETVLPVKRGIAGWFKKEQSVQYDAALAVEVAVVDAAGTVLASAQAKAIHSRTLLEGATRDDKRAAWAAMIQASFDSLDAGIADQVRSNLSGFVR